MKIEQFREQVLKQSEITGAKKVSVNDEDGVIYGSVIDSQVWCDAGSPAVDVKLLAPFGIRAENGSGRWNNRLTLIKPDKT